MPIRTERWAEGTPCWVDLSAKDLQGAVGFYGELFGWTFEDAGEEAGHYHLANNGGEQVAGIGPAMSPDQPSAWTTYIAADSADDVAKRVKDAGGSVVMEPFDVLDLGRMFIGVDTQGAAFGLWEAKKHIGAALYNEAGSLVWNDLHTRDLAPAKEFYQRLFGYTYQDMESDGSTYVVFDREPPGEGLGGMDLDAAMPQGVPPHWLTWFGCENADHAAKKATDLGGTVLVEAFDSPFGRMAVLTGPEGEAFGVVALRSGL